MAEATPSPPPDALDPALDAYIGGDVNHAVSLVKDHLARFPDDTDARAFLVELEAPDVRDLSVDGQRTGMRCLGCGQGHFEQKEVLLNTRWMSFFGWDQVNRGVDTRRCTACGLIHWFQPGDPAVYQAMHPAVPVEAAGADEPGGCLWCGYDKAVTRKALVNTAAATFFGLDFLNHEIGALACVRCGFVHWCDAPADTWHLPRMSRPPPDPPLPATARATVPALCLACGANAFEANPGLLNTRVLTKLGLDWLNGTAAVLTCMDCRFVAWYRFR